MSIIVRTPIQSLDWQKWSEFVNHHPEGTVFQSPEMYDFWNCVDHFQPVCQLAFDRDNKIAGVALAVIITEKGWLRELFSSRAVMYGGPLIDESHPEKSEIFNALMKNMIEKLSGKSVFFQIRNFYDTSLFKEEFNRLGFRYGQRLNLLTDTSAEASVLIGMSKSRHRQIMKSLKAGATIEQPSGISEVDTLYEILNDLYKNNVKKPLPGKSFFREFYKKSLQNKLGIIRLIKYRGQIAGGIVCPITPGKTIYEMYVCGLDRKYEPLGIYPSVLATWAPMDYALKHNLPAFDFMGVGVPHKAYGVRDFKLRFGGRIVNYGRYARVNNQVIYTISEIGYNILAFLGRV